MSREGEYELLGKAIKVCSSLTGGGMSALMLVAQHSFRPYQVSNRAFRVCGSTMSSGTVLYVYLISSLRVQSCMVFYELSRKMWLDVWVC